MHPTHATGKRKIAYRTISPRGKIPETDNQSQTPVFDLVRTDKSESSSELKSMNRDLSIASIQYEKRQSHNSNSVH